MKATTHFLRTQSIEELGNRHLASVAGLRDLVNESADPRIVVLVDFVQTHHSRCLSSGDLARHVNLSPSRVRQILCQQLGMSPTQLIRATRLQNAERMVRTTFLTIKEIAVAVGLKDTSHFVRDFKAQYGVTPTQLRRMTLLHESVQQMGGDQIRSD